MIPVVAEDIKSLTGIRFFAALWVVLYHFRDGLKPISILEPFTPFFDHGYLAVPLFFILSGFILSHTYFPRYSLKNHAEFIFLRFARLWPVHVAAVLSLMAYIGVIFVHSGHFEDDSGSFALQHLPGELAMVRSWFSKDLVWNYPAWSIHAEWFAYMLLFPIAFSSFRKISNCWVLLITAGALLAGHTFLPIGQFPGMCAEIIFLFLAGSALYRLRLLLPNFPGTRVATAGLLLVILGVSGLFQYSISLIYLAFAFIIFGLSYDGGWLGELLSQRLFVYGGLISYSIYMTHAVVLKVTDAIFHRIGIQTQGERIVAAVTFVGAVLITASVFYHLIEAPCNKVLRRNSPFRPDLIPQPAPSARQVGVFNNVG